MTEIRQRWRLLVRRDAPAQALVHREVCELWEASLEAAAIPIARTEGERPRPRITFAVPVPAGMLAEREPIEIGLLERWPVARLRAALEGGVPAGHAIVDLHDVWIGAPSIAGQVVGADYRFAVDAETDEMVRATRSLLDASRLPRERARGDRVRTYDLRPLLVGIAVEGAGVEERGRPASPTASCPLVRARLRHDPELGVGRPDELVAALGEAVGRVILAGVITRERLWLAEDTMGADVPPPLSSVARDSPARI
ncbi:MAG TPA: TIGR03936 family radical SAM-associated protein [Candidatus Limnocylindrales bacterium]